MDLENAYTLEHLFDQLGLSSEDDDIDDFIEAHQLPKDVKITDAPYWTDSQRALVKEKLLADDDWAPIIDDLNTRLHDSPQTGNEA